VVSTTNSPGYTSSTTKSIQKILSDLYRKKCACSTTAAPEKLVSTTLTKNTNDSSSNISLEIYAIISKGNPVDYINISSQISLCFILLPVIILLH
jgi:hypothetical protein